MVLEGKIWYLFFEDILSTATAVIHLHRRCLGIETDRLTMSDLCAAKDSVGHSSTSRCAANVSAKMERIFRRMHWERSLVLSRLRQTPVITVRNGKSIAFDDVLCAALLIRVAISTKPLKELSHCIAQVNQAMHQRLYRRGRCFASHYYSCLAEQFHIHPTIDCKTRSAFTIRSCRDSQSSNHQRRIWRR